MDLLTDQTPPDRPLPTLQPTTTWFIDHYGIVLETLRASGHNRRWDAVLSRSGTQETFLGAFEWTADRPPQLGEVLVGLASEAADIEQTIDRADWARYAGISDGPDLPRRYDNAVDQARRLCRWLPVGAYEVLLWDVMLG